MQHCARKHRKAQNGLDIEFYHRKIFSIGSFHHLPWKP
jgi:hypothetical protein